MPVEEIDDPPGVARPPDLERGPELLEALHGHITQTDDDVALAHPGPGGGAVRHDGSEPYAV
jgi:hypothetical protein